MAQQTALKQHIEWMKENQLEFNIPYEAIENAEDYLLMEKEQIVDAHYQGYRNDIGTTDISEQYYNETYKK